ncbi:MAG: Rossmann-like and DUF2520 domain-containing protein [Noviherbaspirillum sp.]
MPVQNTAPTLTILGGGKVGKSLGRLWHMHGIFTIQDVLSRSMDHARQAVTFIGAGRAVTAISELRPADIVLVSTPDDRILACARELAESGLLSGRSIVFHCSGSLPSGALEAATLAGAAVASIHPVRSFADPEQVVRSFAQTWCGAEGDRRALDMLEPAFTALGGRIVPVDASNKLLYHSAAVFASNYLVTLLDVALQAYGKAGIPPDAARGMLEPLVRKTVDNVFLHGPEQALSGPIARGDRVTVARQYRAVNAWDPRFGALYRHLGRATFNLARRKRGHP